MALVASLHKRILLAAAALLVLAAVPVEEARGLTCTWNPSSGNWVVAGNWSCGAVPTGPDDDSATIGVSKTVTINTHGRREPRSMRWPSVRPGSRMAMPVRARGSRNCASAASP